MAIAATISATASLQPRLKIHGLRRLPGERPLVALQRGAGVAGRGGADGRSDEGGLEEFCEC
jgi:hypothetical protein